MLIGSQSDAQVTGSLRPGGKEPGTIPAHGSSGKECVFYMSGSITETRFRMAGAAVNLK